MKPKSDKLEVYTRSPKAWWPHQIDDKLPTQLDFCFMMRPLSWFGGKH